MSKLIILFNIFLTISAFFLTPKNVYAQTNCSRMFTDPPELIENVPPLTTSVPDDQRWVAFIIEPIDKSATYKLVWEGDGLFGSGGKEADNLKWDSNIKALVDSGGGIPALKYGQDPIGLFSPTTHKYYIEKKATPGSKYCTGSYTVKKDVSGGIQTCTLNFNPIKPDETQSIELSGNISPQGDYQVKLPPRAPLKITLDGNGNISTLNMGQFNPGDYSLVIQKKGTVLSCGYEGCVPVNVYIDTNCHATLTIAQVGGQGSADQVGTPGPGGTIPVPPAKKCKDKNDPAFDPDINIVCALGGGDPCDNDPNNPGIKTAIGCIHTSPVGFVKDSLKFIIGISGGLAFLLMLLGAFQMLASAGNPDTLQAGKDRLTSAVIGLLFVIFAVLLLQIIGVDILSIPGFGR